MSDRRYVFDTNTLVSAALFRGGTPNEAFRHALKTGVVLLSKATFEEIDEVIAREKFDDYLTPEERGAFIEALVDQSRFANPTEEIQACRDPDDDKFLELAVSENATCIVSNLHREWRLGSVGARPIPGNSNSGTGGLSWAGQEELIAP